MTTVVRIIGITASPRATVLVELSKYPLHPLLNVHYEALENCPAPDGKKLSGDEALIHELLPYGQATEDQVRKAVGAIFLFAKYSLGDEDFGNFSKDFPYINKFMQASPALTPGKHYLKSALYEPYKQIGISADYYVHRYNTVIQNFLTNQIGSKKVRSLKQSLSREAMIPGEVTKADGIKDVDKDWLLIDAITAGSVRMVTDDLPTRRHIVNILNYVDKKCGELTDVKITQKTREEYIRVETISRSGVIGKVIIGGTTGALLPELMNKPSEISSIKKFVKKQTCNNLQVRKFQENGRKLIMARAKELPARVPPSNCRFMMEACMQGAVSEADEEDIQMSINSGYMTDGGKQARQNKIDERREYCRCVVPKIEPLLDPDLHREYIGDFRLTTRRQLDQMTPVAQYYRECMK